jgi:hypothetical protein
MADEPLKKPEPARETRVHPAGSNEELTSPTPEQELIYHPGYPDHGRPKNAPNLDAPHAGAAPRPDDAEEVPPEESI